MDLRTIVDEIASQADDFLSGTTSRDHARAGIAELLAMDYGALSPADRKKVTTQVLAILEEEGFFEATPGGEGEDDAEDEVGEE